MSGVAGVERETEAPVVAAGAGLGALPGLPGWCRAALESFVAHSGSEGRENESVGVFLVEPYSVVPAKDQPLVSFMREVVWRARYLALENELLGQSEARSKFLVGPEQIEMVYREAEARQDAFFKPLGGVPIQGRRYFPMLGLGHTHPRGTIGASREDLAAFEAWDTMSAPGSELVKGRIVLTNHFVYSFGSFQDTLISLDKQGTLSATWQGDFQAAVQ